MKWEVTKEFQGPCTACGCIPYDERSVDRPPLAMIRALELDINFGEDLNLCMVCVSNIADLVGRPDQDEVKQVADQYTFQKKRADKLDEKLEKQEVLIERVKSGAKARKELSG